MPGKESGWLRGGRRTAKVEVMKFHLPHFGPLFLRREVGGRGMKSGRLYPTDFRRIKT
jgi:hypothetical protein